MNITAFTEPGLPSGGQLVRYCSVNLTERGDTAVTCRDRDGRQVTVEIPGFEWRRMVTAINAA